LSPTDSKSEKSSSPRSPGLDFFRFLAALVVFLGHAFFFAPFTQSFSESPFVQWFRTGTFAVDFFFVLSGYVLAEVNPTLKWISARYVRLFPVYIVGLLLGMMTNLAVNQNLGSSVLGVILAFLGIQSLFASYALAVNGPLWSLSVEIILTPLFKIFWRLRGKTFGLISILVVSISLLVVFSGSPVIRAVPFFTLGAFLRTRDNNKIVQINKKFNLLIILSLLFYLVIGAGIIRKIGDSVQGASFKLMILGFLIFCLRRIVVGSRIAKLFTALGKRTYVLYVVHGPIVGFLLAAIKPTSLSLFLLYFVFLVAGTAVASEVVYRHVEVPALTWARKVKGTQLE
jgi:peptidoglycan/LPS O-acetylase OafA/YrhL